MAGEVVLLSTSGELRTESGRRVNPVGVVGTDTYATVAPSSLPVESAFWWTTEPQSYGGRVYVGTCGPDNSVWLQEWSEELHGAPWLHRYFLGFAPNVPGSDRDDHQAAGIAVAAGKPVVAFWSGHSVDHVVYYRQSEQNIDDVDGPAQLTFGPLQRYEMPVDTKTSYSEVMHDGTDIYLCHRTGWNADVWSISTFPAWATGTPSSVGVFSSADQFYVKARLVDGVIRCTVADHPSIGTDNKVWWAEIDLASGDVTKADGTVLGNMDGTNLPLAEASLDLVFTATGSERPWIFDVGHTDAVREVAFVTGRNYPLFATTADYMHAEFDGAAWVSNDIATVGSFIGGAYFPSIQFVPDTARSVVLAREAGGRYYVERKTTTDGDTWTTVLVDQEADTTLTRVFPVHAVDGVTPIFEMVGTEIDEYPTYDGEWISRVVPLPRGAVSLLPADTPPIPRTVAADGDARPGAGLYFPGTSGSYIYGPDVDVPSDGFRLEVDLALDDWTPASPVTLFAKESSATNREQRLVLAADGKLGVYWSEDGSTALSIVPNEVVPADDGQRIQLAAVFTPLVNGGSQFAFRSFYRFADDESWLGLSAVALPSPSSLFASNAPWEVGSRWGGTTELPAGTFYRASVMTAGGDLLTEWRADRGTESQKDRLGNAWSRRGAFGGPSPTFTSTYNGTTPLRLGAITEWYDTTNVRRRKATTPASATDGVPIHTTRAITTYGVGGTLLSADDVAIVTHTGTMTLPSAVSQGAGKQFVIKATNAAGCSVATTGAETVDGSGAGVTLVQWETLRVVSDGANWVKI